MIDRLVGSSIGQYDVVATLGSGGMGSVYKAVHRGLEQPRAIKLLSGALADSEEFVKLFHREARLAAQLRHPNIVQIFDVSAQGNVHYIVMELVDGRSLRDIVRQDSPLDVERALRLLRQLALALDFAHDRGVAHRDVKSSNALVDDQGHLTLIDFGIAYAAGVTHAAATRSIGTPEYMAPEVLMGEPSGEGSDLYALGVVAFELLTGRLPFSGQNIAAVSYAQVNTPPPAPRSLRPELSQAMETVVLRQLAKRPEGRFPTAVAFADALTHAAGIQREQITAELPTPHRRPLAPTNGGVTVGPTRAAPPTAAPTRAEPPAPQSTPADRAPVIATIAAVAAVAILGAAGAAYALGFVGSGSSPTPTPSVAAKPTAAVAVKPTAAAPPATPLVTVPTAPPQPTGAATAPPAAAAPSAPPAAPTPLPADRMLAALSQVRAGQAAAAIPALEGLKRSDPATPGLDDALVEAYVSDGRQLLERGRLADADLRISQALVLRPTDGAALHIRREVDLAQGWAAMEAAWGKDDEAAIRAARQVFAIDPTYRGIREKLYSLLVAKADRQIEAGDRDGAAQTLAEARNVDPSRGEALDRQRALTPTPVPPPTSAPQPKPQAQPQPTQPPQQAQPTPQSKPQAQPTPQPKPQTQPQPAGPTPTKAPFTPPR
jgi:serine/threonine-protein kinase